MNRKLLITICIFLVLAPLASARHFVIDSAPSETTPEILSFRWSELNYHTLGTFEGLPQFPFTIVFFDADSEVIFDSSLLTTVTAIETDSPISSFKVYEDDTYFRSGATATPVFEARFNTCNNNGICEPCLNTSCTLIENSLICDDCPSGSSDFFCDLIHDGICDPDCEFVDGDCPECVDCAFKDLTCETAQGSRCAEGESCIDGSFAFGIMERDEPVNNCCVGGTCGFEDTNDPDLDLSVDDVFIMDSEIEIDEDTPGVRDNIREFTPDEFDTRLQPDPYEFDIKPYAIGISILIAALAALILFTQRPKKGPNYTYEISPLLNQGYSHQQIVQILKNKGLDPYKVEEALKKMGK
ncbi:hypothetical protein ACFL0V_05660 [Nanoarchaeota archaeon]